MVDSPSCVLCSCSQTQFWWEHKGFPFYCCSDCDLLFLAQTSLQEAMDRNKEIYDGIGQKVVEKVEEHQAGKREKHFAILRRLEPYRRTGKILDIGCGQGGFLRSAQERGWEPEGVELAPHLAKFVREHYSIPVHVGTLEDLELEEGSYDVIFFNELLEHIPQPRPFLTKVYSLLRFGGAIFLRTRNHRSFSASFCQEKWKELPFFSKGHVCFYSPSTMKWIFPQLGFRLRSLRTWGVSLHPRFASDTVGYRLAKVANKIMDPFAKIFRKGHRIEVLALKNK
ncbi:MAG: class I SAM-dependent methyltransferase [Planctomycetota bacterium]|nr:MAG: class I SAM-dependent methyltransferase [Planctomycetota bacterium]